LHVLQGKGDDKLRIAQIGQLEEVLQRIRLRKAGYKVSSTSLVVNERGRQLTKGALRDRFDKAREAAGIPKDTFQFRDLRAKAGTDKADSAGDIRVAQKQLGHRSVTTTEIYVRNRKGAKSDPTK
jgi:integrase